MKRSILAVICVASSLAIVSARAQVVPAATSSTFHLSAGALGSLAQPDYDGNCEAATSPNRIYGPGAFIDFHFSRWIQLEAEGRWLRLNQTIKPGTTANGESTYLIGPRIPVGTFHRVTPYGKFLVGLGNGPFLSGGNSFVLAYGGGVDVRLTRRFTLRAVDFEYQQWLINSAITLQPYGGSVGISYKIF